MIDEHDLEFILEHAADDLRSFSGARIFVTGGTGFVGKWLLEAVAAANRRLGLDASIVLLTRDPDAFRRTFPHLAGAPGFSLTAGDITTFATREHFDLIIHAATPASAELNDRHPDIMLSTIIDGTRNALAIAERSGPIPFLFTSSGAVYGPQPANVPMIDETYTGAPNMLDARSAYHEGKRCAELQCSISALRGVRTKIARMFAFVGPYLPIDRHFAVGNFVRDALAGGPIMIGGDGTAVRSYLYAADMAIWLWRICARAPVNRAYNVGSENALDMTAIARAVGKAAGQPMHIEIRSAPIPGQEANRYIPSTARARQDLELETWTSFDEALTRTIAWHRGSPA